MRIKDLCESERPREKMIIFGAESLSNGELLAILLRNGSATSSALDLAQKLLKLGEGSLSQLFQFSSEKICSIQGIGQGKACSILAAFELGRRFIQEESSLIKKPIVSSRTVYEMMLPQLKGLDHEEFWILLLNTQNYLLKKIRATTGGSSSTVIDIPQVIRCAIEHNACSIIMIHNHPSGNPHPSSADVRQTEAMHKAAKSCSLSLLDHIVICDDCFYSFADEKSCRA